MEISSPGACQESCSTQLFAIAVRILRWYGTPCNIYKNERLKYDYNYGFKSFRNFNIFPKDFTEEIKKNKADARFEPATLLLIIHPSTDWTTRKVMKFSMNKYQ